MLSLQCKRVTGKGCLPASFPLVGLSQGTYSAANADPAQYLILTLTYFHCHPAF